MLAGPVTLEKRGIATALLTASREICEFRPKENAIHQEGHTAAKKRPSILLPRRHS